MDIPAIDPPPAADAPSARGEAMLRGVAALLPDMQLRAADLDRDARFPAADFAGLRQLGVLAAPLPCDLGGIGFGTEPDGADGLRRLLVLLGRGNPSVGRLFEAHVNAIALIARYGTAHQLRRSAEDMSDGHLFALWVTGAPGGLTLAGPPDALHLDGTRAFCSAAGWATRAVLTVAAPTSGIGASGPQMLVANVEAAQAEPLPAAPQGMRAAANGLMRFDHVRVPPHSLLGAPGDYLREPAFSAGAWRTAAVIAGGLQALVQAARDQLQTRDRHADPHQLARIGQALIAQETAQLWLRKAAVLAELATSSAQDVTGYVNLTRAAVERASLDGILLVQRSLGLSAFLPPNPAERLMRDLATYLRQPAGDAGLTEAAAWFMPRDLPGEDRPG